MGNTTRSLAIAAVIGDSYETWICLAEGLDAILPEGGNVRIVDDENAPKMERVAVGVIDSQSSDEVEKLAGMLIGKYPGIRLVLLDHTGNILDVSARYVNLRPYGAVRPPRVADGLMEGVEFAILRDEFLPLRSEFPCVSYTVENVMVTIGGEDDKRLTLLAMKWLEKWVDGPLNVTVLLGPLNRHAEEVRRAASGESRHHYFVDGFRSNISKEMLRNDLVICGGGGTVMELAFLGVPVIALPQNLNEVSFLQFLAESGFDVDHGEDMRTGDGGRLLKLFRSYEVRQRVVEAGWNLFDGKGAERIGRIISEEIKLAG